MMGAYVWVGNVLACRLRWWRACRAVWTGRCCSGSCLRWGSAVWPAFSPDRRSGSASYSGSARPAIAAGGGTGSSPLSPHWEQRRAEFSTVSSHQHLKVPKGQRLPSAPEVPPGSVEASTCAASLIACVTGNQVLGWQLRSHVTHWLDGDPVWRHRCWRSLEPAF